MFKGLQIKVILMNCGANVPPSFGTIIHFWTTNQITLIKRASLFLQYVRGSDPVLKLLDDNGNIAEELSILKWNTDSVEEFLSEKLDRI